MGSNVLHVEDGLLFIRKNLCRYAPESHDEVDHEIEEAWFRGERIAEED